MVLPKLFLVLCLFVIVVYCGRGCSDNEYRCRDGTCIHTKNICDDKYDCADHSDEEDCGYKLCRPPTWFKCADNITCIEKSFVCDARLNCPGGDDELNCEGHDILDHVPCEKDEFMCSDKICIPIDFTCDGKVDCVDKSDETVGCIGIEKRCKGFLCKNKHCLESIDWICDGYDDCGDGSDEIGCVNNCKIEDNRFACKDTCISLDKVCDNNKDCPDGRDENGLCSSTTRNCAMQKCPSKCKILPTGPQCICPKGFSYNEVKNACEDIDECQTYGICSHGCVNTIGSYKCTCAEKFKLKSDAKSCIVESGEPLLLYTTQTSVVGLYLKSRHLYHVAQNLSQVIGVTYDGHNVYWTDITHQAESIVRAREDGTKQEVLLTNGIETPEDIAIDWVTGNIYFTDNLYKHVVVCSNNGYYCVPLIVENIDQPRGIVLHPKMGIMFWTDWGRFPMIGKSSMDGKNAHSFINTNIHWPNGLSLDLPNRRLYWVDAKFGTIESVHLDGTGRHMVLDKIIKHPYGIAVFEDRIYWSDWETKSIHTCNKFTGKHHKVIARDKAIYDVHIYHSAIQQKFNHSCMDYRCSHLCLLSANSTFSCACPVGMELGVDQLTCKQVTKKKFLYLGIGNYLIELKYTTLGRHPMGNGLPLPMYIHKIEFNSRKGTLFIADNLQHSIFEVDPVTKNVKTLIKTNLQNVSALAYDYFTDNLYWSDSQRHTIEVFSLKKEVRAIVHHFSGTDIPVAMCVIPQTGKMFIALKSNRHTHIDMQSLHGRGVHSHLFEKDLGAYGVQLIVDDKSETVFVLDGDGDKLEFTDYEGSTRKLFRAGLKHPVSLALIDEDMVWSVRGSNRIYWTHRSNLGPIKKFEINKPPYSDFPEEIVMVSTKPLYVVDHPCQHDNGGCSHICVSTGKFSSACLCPAGLVFRDNTNRTCIEALDCEFRCNSGECITSSRRCNRHKDCADGSDEAGCTSEKTGKKPRKICSSYQFTCHDGTQCILQEFRCDRNFNCNDKSDEEHCEDFDHKTKCHTYQHACTSGGCVDLSALCDGYKDCKDGSDEKICEGRNAENEEFCGNDMFRCISGQCIPKGWECDGHLDCNDASDEHDKCVTLKCRENFIKCPLGHCIDKKLVCDGHNDCGDNFDERDCEEKRRKIVCGDSKDDMGDRTKFQCPSDLTKCLELSAVCNGTAECPRGEDEVGCTSCTIHEFQCKKSHKCIRLDFRCDKEKDCDDGSDEMNCNNYNKSSPYHHFATACHDDMFDCTDGTCIDRLNVCDGNVDCEGGQDESSKCKTSCEKSPCTQICSPYPNGPVCSCYDGYRLNADKKSCIDLDECHETKPCAQICENTLGSYRCSCYPGFMLQLDKTACKSISGERYMLFSTYNQVRKLSDNPVALQILWNVNDSKIIGMDVNIRKKMVYFSVEDSGSIYQHNLENGEVRFISDVGNPIKISVDWITNNIYFVDHSDFYSIKVCHFHEKQSACARLLRHSSKDIFKTIAVDAVNKYIFYSVMHFWAFGPQQTVIYKAGLDGTRLEVIVEKANYVSAMECDVYKKTLYYIDLSTKSLRSVSYSGGDQEIVIKHHHAILNPTDLSIYENVAYIINLGIPEAVKCQLYGDRMCHAFSINVFNAEDIVLVGESRQKVIPNVCESNKCSLICVQAENGPKCLCHGGKYIQPGEQCNDMIVDGVGQRETNDHTGSFSRSESSSSNVALTVCLSLLAMILISLALYVYYRKRYGHGKFNIYMHFQNPLARSNGNNDELDNVHVKMRRPSENIIEGAACNKCPQKKLQVEYIRSLFKSKPPANIEDTDSDTTSIHEVANFENDPRARLVL